MKILALLMLTMMTASFPQILLPGERCYPLYGCICVANVDTAKKAEKLVEASIAGVETQKREFIECQRGYDCGVSQTGEPVCNPVPRKLLNPCKITPGDANPNPLCACYKNEKNEKVFCQGNEECYEIDAYNNICYDKNKVIQSQGTCTTGDCVCMAYHPDKSRAHIAHRPDRCSAKDDVCQNDSLIYASFTDPIAKADAFPEFASLLNQNKLFCGPKEGRITQCAKPCAAGEICWKNVFGEKCYKTLAFDPKKWNPLVMQLGLGSTCKTRDPSKKCKSTATCGLTFDGYLVCSDSKFNYPIIHDNEICLDKKEGCYCTHETNHLLKPALCRPGAMCNTYEASVECTDYPVFEYYECLYKDECGCGGISGAFTSDKGKGYCYKTKKDKSGDRVEAIKILDPDLIMDQRIFRESYWAKLRAGKPIKIANEDAVEFYEITLS